MKKSLPRFTTAFLWWLGVVVACGVGWKMLDDHRRNQQQESENPLLQLARPFLGGGVDEDQRSLEIADEPTVPALLPDSTRASIDAPEMVERAARNLLQYRSLAARVRQRIELFEQPLSGAGIYQQWGRGQEPRRVRLELKLQVAGQTASLQQIGDGRFLWDRRDILGQVSLSRIDLRKVRQAMEEERAGQAPEGLGSWLALGGLSQLLSGIDENFEFTSAEPALLGKLPVWVLIGTWREEALDQFFPAAADAPPTASQTPIRLPAHWPNRVLVVLGADANIPLFPYRVEYQRAQGVAGGAGESGAGERVKFGTLATLELFEVQPGADLDPETFRYDPGNQEVVDETQAFLRRLRGEAPIARAAPPVN